MRRSPMKPSPDRRQVLGTARADLNSGAAPGACEALRRAGADKLVTHADDRPA
ncbi:hypothetical protein RI138_12435 [Streptomyces sp. C11-1]|uniref:Uncharacterized protein n=1 Tax=Streptomyces durocortorensis TaxID=2811104 RepID=A0ABY9VUG8_9ACTN|nr:hypothetical protein [Streptomyces durocortorensis]WNF27579.1 hypothetical protein RI138_12435 [Streptomyces durocortorensis]